MNILVIDGQGGGIGARLSALLKGKLPPECRLLCTGTNALATGAMLKAGCDRGATGENAIVHNAAQADIILGPIGIMLANGIMGEVTPQVATAVSAARAVKILIPSSTCGVRIAGTGEYRMEEYLQQAVALVLEQVQQ